MRSPGRGSLKGSFRRILDRFGPDGTTVSRFAQAPGRAAYVRPHCTRTRKCTTPLPPPVSDPESVHVTGPLAPTAGLVNPQPVMPAPAAAHVAESNTVQGGVASRITMFESVEAPGLVNVIV